MNGRVCLINSQCKDLLHRTTYMKDVGVIISVVATDRFITNPYFLFMTRKTIIFEVRYRPL